MTFIAVTETWFTPDFPLDLVSIPGYTTFSKCRSSQRGGGVAIYAKHDQNPQQLHVEIPEDLEIVWIKLQPPRLPRSVSHIIVAAVYYPPHSVVSDHLLDLINETIDRLLSVHPHAGFAIAGDFNQLDLTQLVVNTRFKQVIKQPTRQNRILDKIVSNLSDLYDEPVIKSPLASIDHSTIVWCPLRNYHHSKNITKTRTTRPLRDSDIRRFGTWMCRHDWAPVM